MVLSAISYLTVQILPPAAQLNDCFRVGGKRSFLPTRREPRAKHLKRRLGHRTSRGADSTADQRQISVNPAFLGRRLSRPQLHAVLDDNLLTLLASTALVFDISELASA